MIERIETCKTCRYHGVLPSGVSQCRHNPPHIRKAFNETEGQLYGQMAVWPVVQPDWFCGAWKHKPKGNGESELGTDVALHPQRSWKRGEQVEIRWQPEGSGFSDVVIGSVWSVLEMVIHDNRRCVHLERNGANRIVPVECVDDYAPF